MSVARATASTKRSARHGAERVDRRPPRARAKASRWHAAGNLAAKREVDRARRSSVENAVGRSGSGVPLSVGVRSRLEPALGASLSGVRVHEGDVAEGAASDIQARAFTVGNDIYLGRGQSSADLALMAHEATHTLQQAGSSPTVGRSVQREIDRAEEIERSRISPGFISGTQGPLRFSLYNFVIGEPTLKAEHEAFLADLARYVVDHPGLLVEVTGHTDDSGTDIVNDPLALARASEVAGMLALNGVMPGSVTGAGERSPVASNASVVGRSRNRRVEVVVYAPVSIVPPTADHDPGGGGGPGTETPEDEEWFCAEYPLLCGITGVSLFCLLFPEICSLPLPALCLAFPSLCDLDDDDDDDQDDEDEEPECGSPELPLSHVEYIPPNGDKGNELEAKPLNRCQGNTTGSDAKRNDPTWPHGWECIAGAGGNESDFWARAHLLHHGLHGPGNDRRNIIISDKSINRRMDLRTERQAYDRVWNQRKTIYYRVQVHHFDGDYPRPYFAESIHIEWGEMDPITGAETTTEFDDTITSNSSRQPPPCASGPDPDDDPPPGPAPTQQPPGYDGPTIGPAPEGDIEPMETPLTDDCGRIACRTLDHYRDSVGHFRGDVYIVTADESIVREMIRLEKSFLRATRFQADVRMLALLRLQLTPLDYLAAERSFDHRVTEAARLRVFDFLVNGSGDPTWRVGRPEDHAAGRLAR